MIIRNRLGWMTLVLLPTVACDQVTKFAATSNLAGAPSRSYLADLFRLGYAENRGAFLSVGASLTPSARFWLFTIGVALLLVGLTAYTLLGKGFGRVHVAALSLMLAGGVSNWVDRATHGGVVVDFLNLGIGSLRTGIFNVADVAIMGGVAMLLIFRVPTEPGTAPDPKDPQEREPRDTAT